MSLDKNSRKLGWSNIMLLMVNTIMALSVFFLYHQSSQKLNQHNQLVQLYQELNLLDWRLYQYTVSLAGGKTNKPSVLYDFEDQKEGIFKRFEKLHVAKYEKKFLVQANTYLSELFDILEQNLAGLSEPNALYELSAKFTEVNTFINEAFELNLVRFETASSKSKHDLSIVGMMLLLGLVSHAVLLYYTFYLFWQRKVIRPLSILSQDVVATLENNEFQIQNANKSELDALSGAVHVLKKILFELHQARESIKRSERESKALYDQSPSGLLFIRDNLIIKSNSVIDERLGYKKGDLSGKSIELICRASDNENESLHDVIRRQLGAHPIAIDHQVLIKSDGNLIDTPLQVLVLNPTDLSQGYIVVV